MKIRCFKYQGAGNDFVIIDNREGNLQLPKESVELLCNRRYGIGADGLMLLESAPGYDFSMRYFNSDGNEATMCGNGGRCLVAFASRVGITDFNFIASDGPHKAKIISRDDKGVCSIVELGMKSVETVDRYGESSMFLNTGSPHLVIFTDNVKDIDVDKEGRYWRHHKDFWGGTNVNFVEIKGEKIAVRTFERGVEAETFACGTGVTASAIAFNLLGNSNTTGTIFADIIVETLCDTMEVKFQRGSKNEFTNITLTGPATYVFECDIEL